MRTSVTDRPDRSGGTADLPVGAFRLPQAAGSRRPLLAVGSFALVCVSIAAFAGLYASAGSRIPAIVVVRPVAEGQPFTAAVLGQADVSVSGGVGFLPVSEAAFLRGKRAAVALPAGSLLGAGDVTGAAPVAPGDAIVGLALKDGEYPSTGLSPGDRVMVVETPGPGGAAQAAQIAQAAGAVPGAGAVAAGSVLVPEAPVYAVGPPSAASSGTITVVVSVEVTTALAPTVAAAATSGQAALVLLAPSGVPPSSPSGAVGS